MILGPGLHFDIPHSVYHADPCEFPSLSSHQAGVGLTKSWLHVQANNPRLGGRERSESSDAMDSGSLLHMLVLGSGPEIVTIEADDWRTKAAKEKRDEAKASGKLPILAHKIEPAREAAARMRASFPVRLAGCQTEATGIWQSGETWCRMRADAWCEPELTIVDLKTTEDANSAASGNYVVRFGIDLQAAAYLDGVQSIFPQHAGRVKFLLHFCEPVAPFAFVTAELSGELLALGKSKWDRAKTRWASCLATGIWPGPCMISPRRIEAPAWAMSQDLETQLASGGSNAPF